MSHLSISKEIRAGSRKARKGAKTADKNKGLGFMKRDKSLARRVRRVLILDRRVSQSEIWVWVYEKR